MYAKRSEYSGAVLAPVGTQAPGKALGGMTPNYSPGGLPDNGRTMTKPVGGMAAAMNTPLGTPLMNAVWNQVAMGPIKVEKGSSHGANSPDNAFVRAGTTFSDAVSTVYHDATGAITKGFDFVTGTEGKLIDTAGGLANKIVDNGRDLIDTAGTAVHDTTGALGNLGWPLAIGAAAIAAVLLLKK